MSTKKKNLVDYSLIVLLLFFLSCFLFYVYGIIGRSVNHQFKSFQRESTDQFDSTLLRLNSMDKLADYCDSFFNANKDHRTFPGVVSETIRKRFFHGYSYYDMGSNALGVLLEPIVKNGATAIVIPDDILKYDHAACSQQSIVGMQIFKQKKYPVRKVSMSDTESNEGHFSYEVYYENGWHYFDTDQEPDPEILKKYNRPSVAFLAANPDVILQAYRQRSDPQLFKRLLMNYELGPVNKFPAPHAYLYQIVTKYATYFGWILVLSIIILRYILQKRKAKQFVLTPGRKNQKVVGFS